MRKVIHKTVLDFWQPAIPADAEVLDVQIQHDDICVWYLTSETPPPIPQSRTLVIHGTGQLLSLTARKYLGTVQAGSLVWHIFDTMENTGNG